MQNNMDCFFEKNVPMDSQRCEVITKKGINYMAKEIYQTKDAEVNFEIVEKRDGIVTASSILALVVKQRDKYQKMVDKGKGTWPEKDYVRDDVWASWLLTLLVLDGIIQKIQEKFVKP